MMTTASRGLAAALALLLLGACAGSATRPVARSHDPANPDKEYLANRAIERWKLMVERRGAEAYDYLSPGFRELQSREAYVASLSLKPMRWLGAEPSSVECPEGAGYCTVTSLVKFSVPSTVQGISQMEAQSPVAERWIWSGGDWYLVPKEVAR